MDPTTNFAEANGARTSDLRSSGSTFPAGPTKEGLVARRRRSCGADFKRDVVLELLSGETSAAVLCRRYELSPNSLAGWKKAYEEGRLDESSTDEEMEVLKARVRELERLVGQLSLENQFLKKTAVRVRQERNGSPSIVSGAPSASRKRAR
jgi:transposase-like protein